MMPLARRKAKLREEPAEPGTDAWTAATPLSISQPNMLLAGSDREFRRLIHRMLITAGRLEAVRETMARHIGVSGTQYTMLMSLLHNEGERGISITGLADYLEVTGPHVTSEIGKLAAAGYVQKRVNPDDRRSLLIRISREGRARLLGAFDFIREINDLLFDGVSAGEYQALRAFNEKFVKNTQAALDWAERQPRPDQAVHKRLVATRN
jgi:DNA-binding MarR family transcriptional regulator